MRPMLIGVLAVLLIGAVRLVIIATMEVGETAIDRFAVYAREQSGFVAGFRMIGAVGSQHAIINPSSSGHHILKLPFGYWVRRMDKYQSNAGGSRKYHSGLLGNCIQGRSWQFRNAMNNYSRGAGVGWHPTKIFEGNNQVHLLPCFDIQRVGFKANRDIGSRIEFQASHGYISLLSRRSGEYEGKDSYKHGSDCDDEVGILVRYVECFFKQVKSSLPKYGEYVIGLFLWLCGCVAVVLSLISMHDKRIASSATYLLLAAWAIWSGFWWVVY